MAEYVWEEADSTNPWGRKRAKGSHCSKGHEFTEENTFIRPYDKTRVCRECRRQYARKKYQENKKAGKTKSKPLQSVTVVIPESSLLNSNQEKFYSKLMDGLKDTTTPCQLNPEPFDNPERVSLDKAEELCYNCPLLKECYQFAVQSEQEYGIWGGINFTKEVYKNGTEWFEDEGTIDWLVAE
jgi:hypothetical protein